MYIFMIQVHRENGSRNLIEHQSFYLENLHVTMAIETVH